MCAGDNIDVHNRFVGKEDVDGNESERALASHVYMLSTRTC